MSAWIGFNAFVLALLALDLFVFHRSAHEVRTREALGWSVFWIVHPFNNRISAPSAPPTPPRNSVE